MEHKRRLRLDAKTSILYNESMNQLIWIGIIIWGMAVLLGFTILSGQPDIVRVVRYTGFLLVIIGIAQMLIQKKR